MKVQCSYDVIIIGCLIVALLIPQFLFAQQSDSLSRSNLFSGFQFKVNSVNGVTNFESVLISGAPLESPLLSQGSLNLEALLYLKKSVFFSTSFGLLYTTHKNKTLLNGMEWHNYRSGLKPLLYKKLSLGVGHSWQWKPNLLVRNQINFGLLLSKESGQGYSQGIDGGYNLYTDSGFHPYLCLKSNLGKVLRNSNVLELGFYYRHSFSEIYYGNYDGAFSTATFSNDGSELGFNLGYVFSRSARRIAKTRTQVAYRRNEKSYLDKYLRKARYLRPQARLLEISSGAIYTKNINRDPEGFFLNSSVINFGFRIELELGDRLDQFWELGFHATQYFSGYRVVPDGSNIFIGRHSSDFYALGINFGRGYRIRVGDNYNLFSISGGLTANINISPGGLNGRSNYSDRGRPAVLRFDTEVKNVYFPSVYANFNKDWRLTDRMYISMNYRYNLGFIPTQIRRYELEIIDSGITREFDGVINGTSHSYELGLKFLLGKKPIYDLETDNKQNVDKNPGSRKSRRKKLVKETKDNKKEWPKIGQKSKLLGIRTGLFNPINISGDPENLITDGSFGTAGFRLNMEFCRGPNHFWDSGLHFANYSETILFNIDSQSGESDVVTNGFHGLSAHIGRGYRFRLRNSYNILTVSAGLTGTFVVVEQAYTGLPFEFEAYDRIALLSYEAKSTARVAPSIFLNVNKDFRITEGIFFSIDYRYNYGWKTMFSKEVKIDAQNPLESRNFNVDINGTSHVFEFGLKLLLGKNKDSSDGLLPRM